MRNLNNAIIKVNNFQGLLSEALIVRTAKQSINQFHRGWIQPNTSESAEAIDSLGLREFLEKPLIGKKLDKDLTKKGLEFLNRIVFTSKRKQRKTKDAQQLGDREIIILQNFSYFTFDGFYAVDNGSMHYEYVPIWRVHSNNQLDSFSYIYTGGRFSFGGGLEILD